MSDKASSAIGAETAATAATALAPVKGFFPGYDVPAVKTVVDSSALFLIRYLGRHLRKIGAGGNGLDPRQGQGAGGVNVLDHRVGMGTAQQLAVQQPSGVDIGGVAGPAHHFIRPVMADGTGTHHIELP